MMKTDARFESIENWLNTELGISDYRLEVASADASFRRYFRLTWNAHSWVIMDAPPEKEDCLSFVKVATLIEAVAVQAPHIYDFNERQGFMRLSDLGSISYLDELSAAGSVGKGVDQLYTQAIEAIVKMQSIQADLPAYNAPLLHTEMNLFRDWYLGRHLNVQLNAAQNRLIENTFDLLVESALEQPVVFVHRDYHSRNLLVVAENNPGVIDFQDAVNGPASYDLVSLIKDCYIAWPRDKQLQWIDEYLAMTELHQNNFHQDNMYQNKQYGDKQCFIRQFDLMGLQRHLKAVGIFARLNHRDNKPGYMGDIPRTLAYVFDVCERYEVFADFKNMLLDFGLRGDPTLLKKIQ